MASSTSSEQPSYDRNHRFRGCGALVTGAGSGIGRQTALAFAQEGASVYASDINAATLAETAELGAGLPGAIHTGVHDVSNRAACFETVAAAQEALEEFNILCNIAGVSWAEHAADVSEEMWDQMLAINLSGVFWMSQAALPHLLQQAASFGDFTAAEGAGGTEMPELGSGGAGGFDTRPTPSIINIASNAGLFGQAYTIPYCASKGGVVLLTKSFAMEFAKTNLRVNAVAPGGVDTALSQNFHIPDKVDFTLMQPYMGYRGMSHPRAMANAILFLASAEANRIHGTIFSVDAGLTAG